MSVERGRMVATAAEALDLAVERLVEHEPDLPLPSLVTRLSAFCEDVLVDFDASVAKEATYLFIALRLVKQRRPDVTPAAAA